MASGGWSCLILLSCLVACSPQQQEPLDWAKGAVWYQIFPGRFHNGDSGNDPVTAEVFNNPESEWQVSPWTSDWYQFQPWEKARGGGFYDVVFDRRYGGDLIGVVDKLDYLKQLGIDVIYFNPIFEAHSLHKYDASTYHHIDNNFGPDPEGDRDALVSETQDPETWSWTSADSVFLDLIEQAHKRGIRIVIDGVFNHSGVEFWAFQDIQEKQQDSDYRDWFDVTAWDDPATPNTNEFDYNGWWGYKGLPEFKEDENGLVSPVRDYVFDITRRWMDPDGDGDPSDGVDGWRLDVANEVAAPFWHEWSRLVKTINPAAITVGELWDDASEWIKDGRFDNVMNYLFAKTVVDFFVDQDSSISVSEFDNELKRIWQLYPGDTSFLLMNLVAGHDTDRLSSRIKNPDRNYDRDNSPRNHPDYDPTAPSDADWQVFKLITTFQFAYIGAPMLFYGDEAGMWGADDPDDRKPMVWPDMVYDDETYTSVLPNQARRDPVSFRKDIFDHFKKLIRIRKQSPAIRAGNVATVFVDDELGVYAFSRSTDDDRVLVVLNNGDEAREMTVPVTWPDASRVRDALTDSDFQVEAGQINLKLEKKSAMILQLAN